MILLKIINIYLLFSENSNRKSLNSTGNNISRDSTKTPVKIRRDEKHLCPYW
jgi:hypothetical protein